MYDAFSGEASISSHASLKDMIVVISSHEWEYNRTVLIYHYNFTDAGDDFTGLGREINQVILKEKVLGFVVSSDQ